MRFQPRQRRNFWLSLAGPGRRAKELAETLYPRIHGSDTSRREPDYDEHYKQSLKKNGKSKTVLYLEYRAKDSETALSKSQYFAKVRKYLKKCRLAMRQQHLAGEVVYIDYAGTKISYEKDGKKVWLKVFVGVLGASFSVCQSIYNHTNRNIFWY